MTGASFLVEFAAERREDEFLRRRWLNMVVQSVPLVQVKQGLESGNRVVHGVGRKGQSPKGV